MSVSPSLVQSPGYRSATHARPEHRRRGNRSRVSGNRHVRYLRTTLCFKCQWRLPPSGRVCGARCCYAEHRDTAAASLAGESNGDGTLAVLTFEVVTVKASTLILYNVILSDSAGVGSWPRVENGQVIEAALTPKETALLPNYPNPLTPETWLPYHLAHAADVTLTVYDTKGAVVRRFELGHQPAGFYIARAKAAYWNGRNEKRGIGCKWGLFLSTPCGGLYRVTADGDCKISRRDLLVAIIG